MAEDKPAITVTKVGDLHICDPTETEVEAGDTVEWRGAESFLVFFPDETPFVQGRGPFLNGQRVTVKDGVPNEKRWTPKFQVSGRFLTQSKGDIKTHGG